MRWLLSLFLLIFCAQAGQTVEFIHPSDIRPGMKGYGLSVFRGWEPERFEVEVIDVMRNKLTAGDIILVRVSGAGLEKSGVIAGMSGSPVYLEGRLAGALAFTWAYAKEPLAGITPIGMMLEEKQNADPDFYDQHSQFKRIITPLMVSGLSPLAMEYLQSLYSNQGLQLVQSGGSGFHDIRHETLKPGDSVSINLVEGDLDISAIGTVTYVEGKDIYIFGHPMGQFGNLSLPISRSYVYSVMPSSVLSFKLGAASYPLGATLYDGQTAVYCELGRPAGMVPVQVKVDTWQNSHTFQYRVAAHSDYFPSLIATTLISSLTARAGYMDEKSLVFSYQLEAEYQGQTYRITNRLTYAIVPAFFELYSLMMDLDYLFSSLQAARFGDIRVTRADFHLQVEKAVRFFSIENVLSDRQAYEPGDTVHLTVVLKQRKSGYQNQELSLSLPEGLEGGNYRIYVGNDAVTDYQVWKLFPHTYQVNSMPDLVRELSRTAEVRRLTALFIDYDKGMVYQDRNLDLFPETYIRMFNVRNDQGKYFQFPSLVSSSRILDLPVLGSGFVNIKVLDKTYKKVK